MMSADRWLEPAEFSPNVWAHTIVHHFFHSSVIPSTNPSTFYSLFTHHLSFCLSMFLPPSVLLTICHYLFTTHPRCNKQQHCCNFFLLLHGSTLQLECCAFHVCWHAPLACQSESICPRMQVKIKSGEWPGTRYIYNHTATLGQICRVLCLYKKKVTH